MHDLTEEQLAKIRTNGDIPLKSIRRKFEKRPQLYALYGFKDQAHFDAILNLITTEIRLHYESTKEKWMIDIQNNPSVGAIIALQEPLLNKLNTEDISSLKAEKTPYPTPIIPYSPRVFRYMNEEFVDDFFKEGKLRLSSFKAFANHENPNMKDKDEGSVTLIVKSGTKYIEGGVGFGDNSLVLCCSVLDDRFVEKPFDYNAGFCIENLEGFIQAILFELKIHHDLEIYDVVHGSCIYLPNRGIEGESLAVDVDDLQSDFGIDSKNHTFDINIMQQKINEYVKHHGLFLKENKYAHEHEYRILWNIEADAVPEYIDIAVPDAVKFCKRIR